MTTVLQLLRAKAIPTVFSVSPNTTAAEAARLMGEWNVGALVVLDDGRVAGLVSERDLTRRIIGAGLSPSVRVSEVASSLVFTVEPDQTAEECMSLMTRTRVRHLPVLSEGRLIGLVSIGDLVKDVITDQRFVIEQLEHFITGSPA